MWHSIIMGGRRTLLCYTNYFHKTFWHCFWVGQLFIGHLDVPHHIFFLNQRSDDYFCSNNVSTHTDKPARNYHLCGFPWLILAHIQLMLWFSCPHTLLFWFTCIALAALFLAAAVSLKVLWTLTLQHRQTQWANGSWTQRTGDIKRRAKQVNPIAVLYQLTNKQLSSFS